MRELYSQPVLRIVECFGSAIICVSNGGLEPTDDHINDL